MTTPVPALEYVTDGMVREDRGLLPYPDPLAQFPSEDAEFRPYDDMAVELPQLLYAGKLRARLEKLPVLPVEKLDGPAAIVAFRHFSYFVSAYAWADCVNNIDAPHATSIPANLAVPFDRLAKKLNSKPILAYAMYATNNFSVVDPKKPIRFQNLKLIQHFTIPPYNRDEYGFILPHVEIEAEAGPGLCAIPRAQQAVVQKDVADLTKHLWTMCKSLREMGETFSTMPKVCSPDVYFKHVRPWIFFFQNITYEGVGFFDRLKGETGAESPAIISFDRALGVHHEPSELIDHLTEIRDYRAPRERAWITAVEQGPSLRDFVLATRTDTKLCEAYNATLTALAQFRRQHLDTAIIYIKQKGRGPVATGGTHYEIFLGNLIEETKACVV